MMWGSNRIEGVEGLVKRCRKGPESRGLNTEHVWSSKCCQILHNQKPKYKPAYESREDLHI